MQGDWRDPYCYIDFETDEIDGVVNPYANTAIRQLRFFFLLGATPLTAYCFWSPDGSRIVFSSDREGVEDLYVNQVGGTEFERLLLKTEMDKTASELDEGRPIRGLRLRRRHLGPAAGGGSEPFPVLKTEAIEFNGRVSPDGRWMLYTSWNRANRRPS